VSFFNIISQTQIQFADSQCCLINKLPCAVAVSQHSKVSLNQATTSSTSSFATEWGFMVFISVRPQHTKETKKFHYHNQLLCVVLFSLTRTVAVSHNNSAGLLMYSLRIILQIPILWLHALITEAILFICAYKSKLNYAYISIAKIMMPVFSLIRRRFE
jgi:hypothetical protein